MMKKIIAFILALNIYCSCSQSPPIGSLEHLNLHEKDYEQICHLMMEVHKIYEVENLDLQRAKFPKELKEIMEKIDVSEVSIGLNPDSSIRSISYRVALEKRYINIFSGVDSLKEYKYNKSKLVRLKNRWYYAQTARFGYVD